MAALVLEQGVAMLHELFHAEIGLMLLNAPVAAITMGIFSGITNYFGGIEPSELAMHLHLGIYWCRLYSHLGWTTACNYFPAAVFIMDRLLPRQGRWTGWVRQIAYQAASIVDIQAALYSYLDWGDGDWAKMEKSDDVNVGYYLSFVLLKLIVYSLPILVARLRLRAGVVKYSLSHTSHPVHPRISVVSA